MMCNKLVVFVIIMTCIFLLLFCSSTLVSTELVSSAEQVMCLEEWTMGGGSGGREITVGGIASPVSMQSYSLVCIYA